MDNRNDIQWRPEDWQHTMGYLRKAERLLLLKSWGIGLSIAGSVATGVVMYVQPFQETIDPEVVAEIVVAPENLLDEQVNIQGSNPAVEVPVDLYDSEVESEGKSTGIAKGSDITDPVVPDAINKANPEENRTSSEKSSEDALQQTSRDFNRIREVKEVEVARSESSLAESKSSNSDSDLEEFQDRQRENQLTAGLESIGETKLIGELKPLRAVELRNEGLLRLRIPSTESAELESENNFKRTVPIRISAVPTQKGMVIEIPKTIVNTGPMYWQLNAGLALTTGNEYWTAWHPDEVYGNLPSLRKVSSDCAFHVQGTLAGMVPVNHLVDVGFAVGVRQELTRRMDSGVWDNDANEWEVLDAEGIWGRVEETNPRSGLIGFRVDYAIAPEWKIVTQSGWTLQKDLLRKEVAIDAVTQHPFWIQIGIQR